MCIRDSPIIVGSDINATAFNGALPYFIFASLCLVTILFAWRVVPETKGKTLEEMENLLAIPEAEE